MSSLPLSRARVLTVDDHPKNNEILCGMLGRDHDMVSATSGYQALQMLAEGELPELILLDVMMPDIDGYAVCEALKANERTRDIPVIFVTAMTDFDSEVRAIQAGGVDFMHKPVNINVVRTRVALHLELARHRHRLEQLVQQRTTELADALKRVESASRVKTEFLANMSHEFRTPMNGIIGLTHLVAQDTREAVQRERLNQIGQSAHQLLGVLNDMLDWTQLESEQLVLQVGELSVSELLVATQHNSLLDPEVQRKGLRVTVDVPDALQTLKLQGDSVRIAQILRHFVSNAIKFTPAGSVALVAELEEHTAAAVRFRLMVKDTGLGLDGAQRERIFEAFEQLDGTRTRHHGGAGLGLAICRRLAQLLGGEVGVDSTPGQGSRFWLRLQLPVLASRSAPNGSHRVSPQSNPSMAILPPGTRVLVVDDNAINQAVATKLLQAKGLVVALASNGEEAVKRVQSEAYDLILMDVQMPIMDGLEATRAIRMLPHGAQVPVVALTANAFEDDRRSCTVAGMNDFLAKPINPQQLYATLARCLSAVA